MPRRIRNAQRRWKPNHEHYMIEFGTPLMVATPSGDFRADLGILIGAWALVFAAYAFVAHFVFVMVVGLWGVSLAAI